MADDKTCKYAHKNLKLLFQRLESSVGGESVDEIRELFTEAGLDDKFAQLVDSISKLKPRVEEPKVTVAFLGQYSAGKSTTINCLMRRKLSPTSIGNTTLCTISMEFTDEKSSYYRAPHGRKGDLSIPSEDDLKGFLNLDSKDTFEFFLSHNDCQNTVLDSKQLKLIDFPGWNGKIYEDAAPVIQKADIIVFIGDRESGVDDERIISFLKSMKDSAIESKKAVYLVFNKMDNVFKKSNETWTNLCENIFQEAVDILVTESDFLQRREDARNATFMFSALTAALLRNNNSTGDLEKALMHDAENGKLDQVVCCGSRGVGKTSLCNLLLRSSSDLLPVSPNSAVPWVVCCRPKGSRTCIKVGVEQSEAPTDDQSLEDVLLETEEHIMTVHPGSQLVTAGSILYKCDQLVDSLSSDNTKFVSYSKCLGEASSVIIIVNCDKSEIVQRQIKKHVNLISEERRKAGSEGCKQNVYLVVNLRKKNTDELLQRRKEIRQIFSDQATCLQDRQRSMQRVFFMQLKDLNDKEKFASGFDEFEKRLLDSATTRYIEVKIEILKDIVYGFARDGEKISEDLNTWLRTVKTVCDTLKSIKAKIGDSNTERKKFASRFIEEYRNLTPGASYDNEACDGISINSCAGSTSPLLKETSENTSETAVPKTSEQKWELLKQFFQTLLSDPFGDRLSEKDDKSFTSNDSLIVNNVLGHFKDLSVHSFVRRLCKQAEENTVNRAAEMVGKVVEKVTKKARVEFRSSWLKKFIGFSTGITGATAGAVGTSIVASETVVAAIGTTALTAFTGFAAIGVGAAAIAGIGATGIAYVILRITWPSFKNDEELRQFLEIFHDVWFRSYEEIFNEELQKLVPLEEEKLKNRETEIQRFGRHFPRRGVPERTRQTSFKDSFDLII